MATSLVLTFIGQDRPGLVRIISEKVAAAGGSWLDSRLARLAGEFAGIVLVTVPEAGVAPLTQALHELEAAGLRVTVAVSTPRAPETGRSFSVLTLDLLGHDRPGIVRDVTRSLADLGTNIEEFNSSAELAPFSGDHMFKAAIRLRVPAGVSFEDVRKALEGLAGEIMVDFKMSSTGA